MSGFVIKIDFITEKIIVYSGWPFENGAYAEIIDLSNSQSVSQVFARIPMLTEVELSFGGKVSNDYIYCGGWDGNDYIKECYKVGENTPFLRLLHPRSSGAGVILPNQTLFITGKNDFRIVWFYPTLMFSNIRWQGWSIWNLHQNNGTCNTSSSSGIKRTYASG